MDTKLCTEDVAVELLDKASFAYDRTGIEEIFKMILQKAEEHGIVYDDEEKVFRLKRVERLAFSLKE